MQPGPVFLRPALPRGVWWLSARCGFGSGAGGGGRRGLVSVLPPTKPRPRRLPRVGVPCPGAAGKPVRVQTLLAHRSGQGDGETGRGRSRTPLLLSPSAQRASVRRGGLAVPLPPLPASDRDTAGAAAAGPRGAATPGGSQPTRPVPGDLHAAATRELRPAGSELPPCPPSIAPPASAAAGGRSGEEASFAVSCVLLEGTCVWPLSQGAVTVAFDRSACRLSLRERWRGVCTPSTASTSDAKRTIEPSGGPGRRGCRGQRTASLACPRCPLAGGRARSCVGPEAYAQQLRRGLRLPPPRGWRLDASPT